MTPDPASDLPEVHDPVIWGWAAIFVGVAFFILWIRDHHG